MANMNIVLLTKEETRKLEYNTSNIMNFYNSIGSDINKYNKTWFNIISWYHYHELSASSSLYKRVVKFSELIGYKQLYYIVHVHRHAVWGFNAEYERQKFNIIIYQNIRGMVVQVDNITKEIYPILIKWLVNKLLKGVSKPGWMSEKQFKDFNENNNI
jgi:hypothetical protein